MALTEAELAAHDARLRPSPPSGPGRCRAEGAVDADDELLELVASFRLG